MQKELSFLTIYFCSLIQLSSQQTPSLKDYQLYLQGINSQQQTLLFWRCFERQPSILVNVLQRGLRIMNIEDGPITARQKIIVVDTKTNLFHDQKSYPDLANPSSIDSQSFPVVFFPFLDSFSLLFFDKTNIHAPRTLSSPLQQPSLAALSPIIRIRASFMAAYRKYAYKKFIINAGLQSLQIRTRKAGNRLTDYEGGARLRIEWNEMDGEKTCLHGSCRFSRDGEKQKIRLQLSRRKMKILLESVAGMSSFGWQSALDANLTRFLLEMTSWKQVQEAKNPQKSPTFPRPLINLAQAQTTLEDQRARVGLGRQSEAN